MHVAVFGCGQQGRLHIDALSRIPGVSVRAICDRDGPTLQLVQEQHKIPFAYEDYRDLLSRQEIDLAVICTMPDTHEEIVTAAFASGADVFCEKPFALDRHEAAAMLRASVEADRAITVGFNLRFTESAQQVASLIANGRIGTPTYARLWSSSGFPSWGRHHVTAVSGGGVLAGSAVHGIDLVRWLAGRPRPTSVSAFVTRDLPQAELRESGQSRPSGWDCENAACAVVRFDGFCLLLDAEWIAGETALRHELELVGDRARIRFVPFFSGEQPGSRPEKGPDDSVLPAPDRELADSVRRAWSAILEWPRSGSTTVVSPEDAFVVQAIVDTLYESARSGHEVEVDLSELPDAFLERRGAKPGVRRFPINRPASEPGGASSEQTSTSTGDEQDE